MATLHKNTGSSASDLDAGMLASIEEMEAICDTNGLTKADTAAVISSVRDFAQSTFDCGPDDLNLSDDEINGVLDAFI